MAFHARHLREPTVCPIFYLDACIKSHAIIRIEIHAMHPV